jgi:hypothetical protein
MRRHAAAAGSSSTASRAFLRYLRGDGVEALATVARDAAAAARRALATTTTRDLTSDAPSTSWRTVRASPCVASWRGFAAAGARRPAGGGYGGGRGGGGRAPGTPFIPQRVNSELKAARSADAILSIVAAGGERLDFIHVATAVNTLWKVANARDNLRGDPRYARLLELVRSRCRAFRAHAVANVVHGLGALCADQGADDVDAETAGELMRAVEREIDSMVPQAVANVYNGLTKLPAAAAALSHQGDDGWRRLSEAASSLAHEMTAQDIASVLNALGKIAAAAENVSAAGWLRFATAVERTSGAMNAQNVALVVNAYAEMRNRKSALAAVTNAGWRYLAAAATETAPAMTGQGLALTIDAAKKLDAEFGMALGDDDGWSELARQVPRVAREFTAQHAVLVLSAAGWKIELATALARVDGGWDAAIASVERHLDAIKKGTLRASPDLRKEARKVGCAIMLLSEQKKLDGGGGASFTTDDERRLERVRGELEEILRADSIQWKRYEGELRSVRFAAKRLRRVISSLDPGGADHHHHHHLVAELARVWRDDAYVAARDAWVKSLPPKRKKPLDVSSMETDAEKLALVVWSAEGDATKARAKARRALLEAAGAVLAKAEGLNAEAGGALFDAMTKRLVPEFRERIAEAMMSTTTTGGSGGGG